MARATMKYCWIVFAMARATGGLTLNAICTTRDKARLRRKAMLNEPNDRWIWVKVERVEMDHLFAGSVVTW